MVAQIILLILASLLVFKGSTKDDADLMDPRRYIKVYSQCDANIHQNNGLYYIKPTDDGPVIPVICSNGYTMIDLSLDANLKINSIVFIFV